jgi:hypothetical protein
VHDIHGRAGNNTVVEVPAVGLQTGALLTDAAQNRMDGQAKEQRSQRVALLHTGSASEVPVPIQEHGGRPVAKADEGEEAGKTSGHLVQERSPRNTVESVLEIELQKLEVRFLRGLLVQQARRVNQDLCPPSDRYPELLGGKDLPEAIGEVLAHAPRCQPPPNVPTGDGPKAPILLCKCGEISSADVSPSNRGKLASKKAVHHSRDALTHLHKSDCSKQQPKVARAQTGHPPSGGCVELANGGRHYLHANRVRLNLQLRQRRQRGLGMPFYHLGESGVVHRGRGVGRKSADGRAKLTILHKGTHATKSTWPKTT